MAASQQFSCFACCCAQVDLAALPSIFNAEVLCTGAALTLDAARRAAADAGRGGVDLRSRCVVFLLDPFLGPFLGPFLSSSLQ